LESATLVPASTEFSAGPQDLTDAELGRFGLGVVIRKLPRTGALLARVLQRVYCLFCGRAVAHELRPAGWWFCGNACNSAAGR